MLISELITQCAIPATKAITHTLIQLAISSSVNSPHPQYLLRDTSPYALSKVGEPISADAEIYSEDVEYQAPNQFYDIPPIQANNLANASANLSKLLAEVAAERILIGIMQLPASVAEQYGTEPIDLFDPCKSIAIASDYLFSLWSETHNLTEAVFRYRTQDKDEQLAQKWALFILSIPTENKVLQNVPSLSTKPNQTIFAPAKPLQTPDRMELATFPKSEEPPAKKGTEEKQPEKRKS